MNNQPSDQRLRLQDGTGYAGPVRQASEPQRESEETDTEWMDG